MAKASLKNLPNLFEVDRGNVFTANFEAMLNQTNDHSDFGWSLLTRNKYSGARLLFGKLRNYQSYRITSEPRRDCTPIFECCVTIGRENEEVKKSPKFVYFADAVAWAEKDARLPIDNSAQTALN